MTEEEFKQVRFQFAGHLSMTDEHCTTYVAVGVPFRLSVCQHVPYKHGEPHGRSYTHYMLNGNVYKSRAEFLKAISKLTYNLNT